jgi:hypothetical protein
MTLRSIVQLRVANALTTKPPSLSYIYMDKKYYGLKCISSLVYPCHY